MALCITIHKQKTYMCENNILWSSTWCILSIFQFWNFFAHFIHIAVPRITVFTRKQVDLFWGFPLFQQYLYWSLSHTYSNYYPLNSPSEKYLFYLTSHIQAQSEPPQGHLNCKKIAFAFSVFGQQIFNHHPLRRSQGN